MDFNEKIKITELRNKGLGYKKISQILGINVNSVKSFCRANKLTSSYITAKPRCKQCKKELYQPPKMKTLKFCCSNCRVEWWNRHRDQIKHKVKLEIICLGCGNKFYAYEKENRKYCSHRCYVNTRFKGLKQDG